MSGSVRRPAQWAGLRGCRLTVKPQSEPQGRPAIEEAAIETEWRVATGEWQDPVEAVGGNHLVRQFVGKGVNTAGEGEMRSEERRGGKEGGSKCRAGVAR